MGKKPRKGRKVLGRGEAVALGGRWVARYTRGGVVADVNGNRAQRRAAQTSSGHR